MILIPHLPVGEGGASPLRAEPESLPGSTATHDPSKLQKLSLSLRAWFFWINGVLGSMVDFPALMNSFVSAVGSPSRCLLGGNAWYAGVQQPAIELARSWVPHALPPSSTKCLPISSSSSSSNSNCSCAAPHRWWLSKTPLLIQVASREPYVHIVYIFSVHDHTIISSYNDMIT